MAVLAGNGFADRTPPTPRSLVGDSESRADLLPGRPRGAFFDHLEFEHLVGELDVALGFSDCHRPTQPTDPQAFDQRRASDASRYRSGPRPIGSA